jgi:hypothetical protein
MFKIASEAIKNQKLTTGIFALFPVEGKKAVDLACGYIRVSKISFWFAVFFLPIIYIISIYQGYI